jgi:hypothetical protein
MILTGSTLWLYRSMGVLGINTNSIRKRPSQSSHALTCVCYTRKIRASDRPNHFPLSHNRKTGWRRYGCGVQGGRHRARPVRRCSALPSPTHSPSAELNRLARDVEPQMPSNPDPENRYLAGGELAFCGQQQAAVRLIKSAIDGRYCAYQALQEDRLLTSIRNMPEYAQLLSAAKKCQDELLAAR